MDPDRIDQVWCYLNPAGRLRYARLFRRDLQRCRRLLDHDNVPPSSILDAEWNNLVAKNGYTAKRIVEGHDGRIWVERSESGGAKFTVSLPCSG